MSSGNILLSISKNWTDLIVAGFFSRSRKRTDAFGDDDPTPSVVRLAKQSSIALKSLEMKLVMTDLIGARPGMIVLDQKSKSFSI